MGKLKRAVEDAKRILSTQSSARLEIEAFSDGEDFSEVLTRAKFEELNADLFRKTLKPVEQVLKDAHIRKDQVDEVGASLTPVSICSPPPTPRLFLWVVLLAYPKFRNSFEITLAKNPAKESTLMRRWHTALPSKRRS